MKDIKVYKGPDNILYFPKAGGIQGDMCNPYVIWTLYPIAVWDYVDPDYNDKQYWIQQVTDRGMFPNETYEVLQYVMTESFEECLNAAGYTSITISKIFYKDYLSNPDDRAQQIHIGDAIYNAFDVL